MEDSNKIFNDNISPSSNNHSSIDINKKEQNSITSLSKTFSFSEQIAIFLYFYSTPQKHYETYVLTQILTDLDYVYEYHQKTFEFLVQRHENMKAYFKMHEDKSIERLYDEKYSPKALPLICIEEDATPENLEKIFFQHYDKNYSIEKLPGIKVCIIKANNGLFSLIRGHHCYLEVETAKVLHKEAVQIYKKIYEAKGQISYEHAVSELPYLPLYSEKLIEIHNKVEEKKPLVYDFIKQIAQNYNSKENRLNEAVFGTEYFYEKFTLKINNSSEDLLRQYKIKPHQLFKTIHQITIAKILNVKQPLIFNVNARRSAKWVNHYSCNLINHPFFFEVDFDKTLKQQVEYNSEMNQKMLDVYSPIDAYLIGNEIVKDLLPVGQFTINFVYNNEKEIIFRPDLRLETILDVDFPMNIYFEIYYRRDQYMNIFYISKLAAVSKEKTIQMKKMLIEIYENLALYFNMLIKNI